MVRLLMLTLALAAPTPAPQEAPPTLVEGRFEVSYDGMAPRARVKGPVSCALRGQAFVCDGARWLRQRSWAKNPTRDLVTAASDVRELRAVDDHIELVTGTRIIRLRPVDATPTTLSAWTDTLRQWWLTQRQAG